MSIEAETNAKKKSSLSIYVGDFIEKRENQLQETADEDGQLRLKRAFDKDSIVIKTGEEDFQRTDLDNLRSASTDNDADELSFTSDPIIEIAESGDQIYKQEVYLRQYQPRTPEPVEIQVQEVLLKPQVQRLPVHVYVQSKKTKDGQRTPSPILITSAPPQPPLPPSNGPIVYNKYIPMNSKPPSQQVIIHRYPELPSKPRPIVVEQWLPNKPAPKRVTYHHANRDEFIQKETKRKRNRYIEYQKPRIIIEVEIIRLPVIKLSPEEYHRRSHELTQMDHVQSLRQNPDTLQWRI